MWTKRPEEVPSLSKPSAELQELVRSEARDCGTSSSWAPSKVPSLEGEGPHELAKKRLMQGCMSSQSASAVDNLWTAVGYVVSAWATRVFTG